MGRGVGKKPRAPISSKRATPQISSCLPTWKLLEVTKVLNPFNEFGSILCIWEDQCLVLFLFISKIKLILKDVQSAAFQLLMWMLSALFFYLSRTGPCPHGDTFHRLWGDAERSQCEQTSPPSWTGLQEKRSENPPVENTSQARILVSLSWHKLNSSYCWSKYHLFPFLAPLFLFYLVVLCGVLSILTNSLKSFL